MPDSRRAVTLSSSTPAVSAHHSDQDSHSRSPFDVLAQGFDDSMFPANTPRPPRAVVRGDAEPACFGAASVWLSVNARRLGLHASRVDDLDRARVRRRAPSTPASPEHRDGRSAQPLEALRFTVERFVAQLGTRDAPPDSKTGCGPARRSLRHDHDPRSSEDEPRAGRAVATSFVPVGAGRPRIAWKLYEFTKSVEAPGIEPGSAGHPAHLRSRV